MPKCCSIDGCERPHNAKGLCKRHYAQSPDQAEKARQYERDRRKNDPRRQEAERQRNRTRRDYHQAWADARKDWAAWWERIRVAEDRQDIAAWQRRQARRLRRIRRATKPLGSPRQWIAGQCSDCGDPFVVIRGWWHNSIRCTRCTQRHWNSGDHLARARKYGVEYEPIDEVSIFERDGWRCQICGVKTRGTYPNPRSPSLDHIVPMARSGPHLRHNVQCACWDCNCRKGARSANDQLLLAV
jgi:hypothetical protein